MENHSTDLGKWLTRENSTATKLQLLNLFYESQCYEHLALVISAMLIIWHNCETFETPAMILRIQALANCFTPYDSPDIEFIFQQLATSLRVAMEPDQLDAASVVVCWLLGGVLDEEVEDYELADGLNMYFVDRLHGGTHVAALESIPCFEFSEEQRHYYTNAMDTDIR